MYKKADGGLTAIVIIVVILVFLSYLVNISQRECDSNKDCNDEQYCGSDFACHKIPIIERETTPVIVHRDYAKPAWIIGLALVVVAIIFNIDKVSRTFSRNKEEKEAGKEERSEEGIYTNFPVYYEKNSSK